MNGVNNACCISSGAVRFDVSVKKCSFRLMQFVFLIFVGDFFMLVAQ